MKSATLPSFWKAYTALDESNVPCYLVFQQIKFKLIRKID